MEKKHETHAYRPGSANFDLNSLIFKQSRVNYFFPLQKLIPELQKLFLSKNEANVLKLWPLFVKLLGKVKSNPLHNT